MRRARRHIVTWGGAGLALALLLLHSSPRRFGEGLLGHAPSRVSGGLIATHGSAEQPALVTRVIDGDTVVLSMGERVRYIGVDTPELHHPRKPVQYFAREAAAFNERLVLGKRVRLVFDVERRDRYGRLLAYVFLEDGSFVNAELLRQGFAHVLTIPPNVAHAEEFLALQREAQRRQRGLWADRGGERRKDRSPPDASSSSFTRR